MHYGRKSYTALDPDTIECPKRRRYVRWFAQLFYATPKWANMAKVRAIYKECKRRRAAGEDVQVDHIVPLFHPLVCGLHNEFNLEILTSAENNKKSNNWWPDMPGGINRVIQKALWEPEQNELPLQVHK